MNLIRVVGDIVDISPVFNDVEIIWVTVEREITGISSTNPSMWFMYNDWIYLMVCDYNFKILEQYEDWSNFDGSDFDRYDPGEKEFKFLLGLNPTYFKASPEEIYKSDLGQYCQFELDFLFKWSRDRKIRDILAKD